MNQEELFELVLRSQSGDGDAMEQLLLLTHAPVTFLCRELLQDPQAAEEQARQILNTLYRKLDTLQDPGQYEAWFCRITAARCMQALPQLRWGSTARETEAPETPLQIPADELDREQTIQAIVSLVQKLPEDLRICVLLHCAAGMHSKTIAQVAGYSPQTVRSHLAQGQQLLQEGLEALYQQGTRFAPITTLNDVLREAMYQIPQGQDPIPMVYGILGKEIPVPPDPEKRLKQILKAVVIALAVTNAALIAVLVLVAGRSFLPPEPVPEADLPLVTFAQPTELPVTLPTEETLTQPTEAATIPTEAKPEPAAAPTAATQPRETAAATAPAATPEETTAPTQAQETTPETTPETVPETTPETQPQQTQPQTTEATAPETTAATAAPEN